MKRKQKVSNQKGGERRERKGEKLRNVAAYI
jgi:hypothetical protein